MGVTVRDAKPEDEAFILALNAASTPAVGDMDAEDYRELAGQAHRILVADVDGKPCGFLVLVRPGSAYESLNYAWFELTFTNHLYIDRIAVAEPAKGMGVGRVLYDEAKRIAAANGDKRLTCEVNEQPPNPDSIAFHKRLGFRHLLSRPWKDKVVAMFELRLPDENARWEGASAAEAQKFGGLCRQLADENPYPDTPGLTFIITWLTTELWDQCFSQTEIRNAFQKSIDQLPAYGAGEERRPNSR